MPRLRRGIGCAGRSSAPGQDADAAAGVGALFAAVPAQEASGWRFDTGPSLLLFPDKYRECFAALGERIEDHVDITRVRPFAHTVFVRFTRF